MKRLVVVIALAVSALSIIGETAAYAGMCTGCPPPRCGKRRC